MSVSLVQSLCAGAFSTASGSLAPHAATTATNLLFLGIGHNGGTVAAVADTQGNTWARQQAPAGTNTNASLEAWTTVQDVAALSTTDRITVTFSAAAFAWEAWGFEWSGVDTVDASSIVTGTLAVGAISPAPSETTTGAGDLLIGLICLRSSDGNKQSAPVGWTALTTPGGVTHIGTSARASMMAGSYEAPEPPGTYSWAPTALVGGQTYQACLVSLLAAALVDSAAVAGTFTVSATGHAIKPGAASILPQATVTISGFESFLAPLTGTFAVHATPRLVLRGTASIRANVTIAARQALIEAGTASVLVTCQITAAAMQATPWTVQLDPPEMASAGRVLLDLNVDGSPMRIERGGIDWGDAQIQAYMADQQWGSAPVSFRVPNRMVTIPLAIGTDESGFTGFEAASEALREKVGLLQREGGVLKRGALNPLYADIVGATLKFPDVWGETGSIETGLELVLECLPDFYGPPIALDDMTATGALAAVLTENGTAADIEGDHPARVQITVTDTSGHEQHGLLWATRAQHYDPAAHLVYQAETLTPVAPASVVGNAGASGGQAVSHPSLTGSWQGVVAFKLPHVGTYECWARVYTTSSFLPELLLAWQQGSLLSAGTKNEPASIPGANAWCLVNLGQIDVGRIASLAAPVWSGELFARSLHGSSSVIVDTLIFQCLDESAGQVAWAPADATYGLPGAPVMRAHGSAVLHTMGMQCVQADGSPTPIGHVIGDLPRLAPSGIESRPVELLVKPSRGDLGATPDAAIDAFTVSVVYWPSYLFRP